MKRYVHVHLTVGYSPCHMKKCEGKVGVCVDDQTGADVQDQRGGGLEGRVMKVSFFLFKM